MWLLCLAFCDIVGWMATRGGRGGRKHHISFLSDSFFCCCRCFQLENLRKSILALLCCRCWTCKTIFPENLRNFLFTAQMLSSIAPLWCPFSSVVFQLFTAYSFQHVVYLWWERSLDKRKQEGLKWFKVKVGWVSGVRECSRAWRGRLLIEGGWKKTFVALVQGMKFISSLLIPKWFENWLWNNRLSRKM